jgi:hypothetical protein
LDAELTGASHAVIEPATAIASEKPSTAKPGLARSNAVSSVVNITWAEACENERKTSYSKN